MECLIYKTVKDIGLSQAKIKQIAREAAGEKAGLSIHFVGDKKIKSLNKKYLKKNAATDVLAFATCSKFNYIIKSGINSAAKVEKDLGDVFICVPQVKRQARNHGVSFKEEMTRILVHGLLHLSGRDHGKAKEAKKMFALQEKLVKQNI